MQRIYINEDDKLVIETDNGKIADYKTSTKIEGTFEVDSSNVMKIKHLIDSSNFIVKWVSEDGETFSSRFYKECIGYLVDKKDDIIIKDMYFWKSKYDKLREELINIINKIKEHNSHWYNRKIKI